MIVHVPFIFTATASRGDRRAPKQARYSGFADVAVVEVNAAEAPVAIRLKDGGRTVELRWLNGKLFAPYESVEAEGVRILWSAERLLACLQGANPITAARYGSGPYPRIEDDLSIRQELASTEARERERICALAARVVVIDGQVWKRACEPVLIVDSRRSRPGEPYRAYVRLFDHDHEDAGSDHDRLFRLDEGRLVGGCRMARDLGGDLTLPEFDILMPECLRAQLTERNLLESCDGFLADMRGRLEDATNEFFAAYSALRDELARVREAIDADAQDDGLHLLSDVCMAAYHAERRRGDALFGREGRAETSAEAWARQAVERYLAVFPEPEQEPDLVGVFG